MGETNRNSSAGARLRNAVAAEQPLQVVGCVNAYAAKLAERTGFKAIYLSGSGVAAASLGVPDLGISALADVLTDAGRITDATDVPLLVDVDTGFGTAFNIARTVKSMTKAGVAGIHIEDQVAAKRCGHRPNKVLASQSEMVDRIKAAVDARTDSNFVVMARTDALAVEGLDSALDRVRASVEAGADMVFPEAVTELAIYERFAKVARVPVLANITEFGLTPLYTVQQLKEVGVGLALYPLSAFRAMSAAALKVYQTLRSKGTQESVLDLMQPRNELYEFLDYEYFERKLDYLLQNEKSAAEGKKINDET
jgi:methylisocitrate lyase